MDDASRLFVLLAKMQLESTAQTLAVKDMLSMLASRSNTVEREEFVSLWEKQISIHRYEALKVWENANPVIASLLAADIGEQDSTFEEDQSS